MPRKLITKRMLHPLIIHDTVGEIVANDIRTAAIFREAGIDFCCGGHKSLAEACAEKGLNIPDIIGRLESLTESQAGNGTNFKDWDAGFLCDYIVNTHHKFVMARLPDLVFYTQKIASVHGERHPELVETARLFGQINTELVAHLQQEETVLFPAIRRAGQNCTPSDASILHNEISRMRGEHEFAGNAMDTIHGLTQGYVVPADACTTYRLALQLLGQFEDDLHLHVHLENNILYPKALQLAKNLSITQLP